MDSPTGTATEKQAPTEDQAQPDPLPAPAAPPEITPSLALPLSSITLPESFTIYLARHATPDRTRSDIAYHVLPGPGLNERGRQEASELGAFLRETGSVFILSSPFERARQTAQIASEQAGIILDFDPDLSERQPIEPEAIVSERMLRSFQTCAQAAAQNGPLAIVSHGSPVMVLLKVLGVPVTVLERCRIYDNRNLISMAGAWRVERLDGNLNIRPVFAPQGAVLPRFPEALPE